MNIDCTFPALPPKYDLALRQAVAFVLERFKPVGIIATGTIVRGNPDATSDLDIWVVHLEPMRQRLQKFFAGVPAEIFVNPPWVIATYFAQDQAEGRPISAHMMATGHVVLAVDPIVNELREQAKRLLTQPPTWKPSAIEAARYVAATRFEDATDVAARNPTAANLLLSHAIVPMMHFAFMKAQRFIPRDKDLLDEFATLDPESARRVRRFVDAGDSAERMHLAGEIADRTIGTRGFFEWESEVDPKPRADG